MEDKKNLKLVYTFFLGVLLAVFIGVGVNTFYAGPTYPEYPESQGFYGDREPTPKELEREKEYDKKIKEYDKQVEPYNRNVSIITLLAAFTLIAASIVFENKLKFLSDGIMLGGLFTLLYSIGRGFAAGNQEFIFIAVSAGLVVVLYLGYHKFVRAENKKPLKK